MTTAAKRTRYEGGPDEKIRSLDQLLERHGGYTSAIDGVRNAMSMARERGSRVGEADACAALAELYADLGDMIAAEDLAQRAIRIGDDHSRARAHRCLARIERRRHRLDLAVEHADRATAYALQVDDLSERVRILQEKAVVVALQGALTEAEEINAAALRGCESLGDAGQSLLPGVRWCRGSVLLHAGRYDEASDVLADGKRRAEDLGQPRLAAWIDQVCARVALAAGDFEAGERYATEGMNAFAALRNRYGTAHCRYRLGQIHLGCHRIDEAVRFLREAMESFGNCGDTWIECKVSLELADAYRRRGQIRNAIRLQRIARRTYRQLGGGAQARQATWAMLRTPFTGLLRRRFHDLKGTGSRPEFV